MVNSSRAVLSLFQSLLECVSIADDENMRNAACAFRIYSLLTKQRNISQMYGKPHGDCLCLTDGAAFCMLDFFTVSASSRDRILWYQMAKDDQLEIPQCAVCVQHLATTITIVN
uniref:Uncharacterized protein n=1 Tax=Physcomitrium patens TaxID=3218 RepID=A0A2K1IF87_PHYPA|nr:hypothetical protein PHYPA_028532 [Physcomitrium patens]